jgi:hypothetical protein
MGYGAKLARKLKGVVQGSALAKTSLYRMLMVHRNYLILRARSRKIALKEVVVRIPPLDEDLVKAIRLIGPHLLIKADEKSRSFFERDQNLTSCAEYQVLKRHLQAIPHPQKVLELGPGIGRSAIFFRKTLGWTETMFDLYEATSLQAKYSVLGPREKDTFCGNIPLLERVLAYNGLTRYQICDAKAYDYRLSNLPGPYNLIYSFYAVGFHWSLEHFIDEILVLMREGAVGFFTVPDTFRGFPRLESVRHEVLTETVHYPTKTLSILVIQK